MTGGSAADLFRTALNAAMAALENIPPGPCRTIAQRKLQEAGFWAGEAQKDADHKT